MGTDLAAIAAAALGRPVASAQLTSWTPIGYDPFLAGRSVQRAQGIAALPGAGAAAGAAWSAIVKHTSGPGLDAARRELDAYVGTDHTEALESIALA